MKKGDLVMISSGSLATGRDWDEPGVVIRGIYEGQSHVVLAGSGKNVGTDIAPVVDLMIAGQIVKGVPVRLLERVIR
tara:strand:- start:890 stop:1120 length:231 start_codon:yes stop_codon:yes gene_type:complete